MKNSTIKRQVISIITLIFLFILFLIANLYLDFAIASVVIFVGLMVLQPIIFLIYEYKKKASNAIKTDIYMSLFLIIYSFAITIYLLFIPAQWGVKITAALLYALLIIGGLGIKLREQLKKVRGS